MGRLSDRSVIARIFVVLAILTFGMTPLFADTTTLSIMDSWGNPGSSDNMIFVSLDNQMGVGGVQFTLVFAGSLLTADSVHTTTRSSNMDLGYNTWQDSVKILVYSASGDSILPGTGSIVEIFFSADTGASVGDSTLLHLKDYIVSDPLAHSIPCVAEDGWFYFVITPVPPVLLSPTDGSFLSDSTPTFVWSSVNGASRYWLQVDEDSIFSSPLINDSTVIDSLYTPATGLADTSYYWRVCAGNRFEWSSWSSTWGLEVDTKIPEIPNLTSPADSSILSDNTPTFIWSKVTKNTSSFKNVKTSISGNKATDIIYDLAIILDIDTTFYQTSDTVFTLEDTLSEAAYLWQVQAVDEAGNKSGYSEPFTLFIDTQAPEIESTTVWHDTSYTGPFSVYSTVSDQNGVHSVELWYKTSVDTNWVNITMDTTETVNQYLAQIPQQSEGTEVYYYIYAQDNATPPNEAKDPWNTPDSSYSFIAGYTGVAESPSQLKKTLFISHNYPNPFPGTTQIRYGLPKDSWVSITIYNLTGQKIITLVNKERKAGYYSVSWDGRDNSGKRISNGIYFLRFEAVGHSVTTKLLIMR